MIILAKKYNLIAQIRQKQKIYSESTDSQSQKRLGQYFTDSPIAEFMSSLINLDNLNPDNVKLLDCGAGYGMLTTSTALHLLNNGINNLDVTVYELDDNLIEHLNVVLEGIKEKFKFANKQFSYTIINDDFVVLRPDINNKQKFDISVINPPYFKYSAKNSIYSKKTADLFKGEPNIYASFIAITISALNTNGQIVCISPRSFLNGLYFKSFRKFLLNNSRIDLIHIFNSRNEVFADSKILQENVIFKLTKTQKQYPQVTISSSKNIHDLDNPTIAKYPKDIIIDVSNSEEIIRVPEREIDFRTLQKANVLPSTFSEEGYFISTGPVVEHRTQEYLTLKHHKPNQVPLLKAHNVSVGGISWDGNSKKDISFRLLPYSHKHLLLNKKYLILKRFTSKEEKRRLVAGIYNPINGNEFIAITNKLNYIGRADTNLTNDEALGLAVLFNSEFMDNYYRCISGNTQVNATDIRIMKIPTRDQIIQLGKNVRKINILNYVNIENSLKKILNDRESNEKT
ncbi:MAG: Eco57I restriction-modification methylase domain-containing protein [Patiriisocius sp.]|uniref:Eco57I restriction-modification methylase domain-containing protein n=1 Tax=Patiriisocius sp. TaxID=2822396 RepID=UPI003EF4E6CB